MIKRLIDFLFGWKLPCGHVRCSAKLGVTMMCPVCGTGYFRARFVCKEPRRYGCMVFQEDLAQ